MMHVTTITFSGIKIIKSCNCQVVPHQNQQSSVIMRSTRVVRLVLKSKFRCDELNNEGKFPFYLYKLTNKYGPQVRHQDRHCNMAGTRKASD